MKIARQDCPECGSYNLIADYLKCDENSAWRTITCEDCLFMWNEIYEFSHNEDVVTTVKLEF